MTDKKHTLISDAEQDRIQKMIASDPDSPKMTDDDMASAKPFTDAFPKIAETMRRNVGGRPKSANPKMPISIRLDQDVIAKFKATGPGWQSLINEVLRKSAAQ